MLENKNEYIVADVMVDDPVTSQPSQHLDTYADRGAALDVVHRGTCNDL